jgi:hypothetical protein
MKFNYTILIIVFTIMYACKNSPKVLEVQEEGTARNEVKSDIFSDNSTADGPNQLPPVSGNVHAAKALEALPTEKYVYIRVEEDGEEYWIATMNQPIEIGKMYYFKEGLLKVNFESKEYNRVFERLYLVSSIVTENHGHQSGGVVKPSAKEPTQPTNVEKPIKVEGSISIAELVSNVSKYAGKEVQISGVCTKINPNIMGRNWIHIEDGTMDEFDMVLTTDILVPEGSVITMKGKVATNLDFGAGYRYDLLIENAVLVK